MSLRFALLGLVLAKRPVAIHWLQTAATTACRWLLDLQDLGVAEERKLMMERIDEHAEVDLERWAAMLDCLTEMVLPSSNIQTPQGEVDVAGSVSGDPTHCRRKECHMWLSSE
ncbi:hypothetical protein NDU88_002479 [Pleurodeles waltl]|uniref:Uncharacterized protein n=1 Tax=Pleurodeles waltl TaxID=8319 RepID=A0AAV7QD11_PLEWA|nr:hypothetical protein NDU88_002479 [Pleurodeles waltl]